MARTLRNRKAQEPVGKKPQVQLEVEKTVAMVGKSRKGGKIVVEKVVEKNVEMPSSTAGSAVLSQEVAEEVAQEGENGDVKIDDEEEADGDVEEIVVDGQETEESQTLLDIRREAAEALAREDQDGEEEGAAPPSSQPRPAVTQESTQEDEEVEGNQEGENFEGEYSYADLSENFSAQDGDAEDVDGLDLEAFEYDPEDKEFLEELLAVAPEEEKDLLRRLSIAKGAEGQNDGEDEKEEVEEIASTGMTANAQQFLPLADKFIRGRDVWQLQRKRKCRSKFSKLVYDHATQTGKLSHEEAATVVRAMHRTWANDEKLVKKRIQQVKEKSDILEAAAQIKLEKVMARRQILQDARQERLAEKQQLRDMKPRRTMREKYEDVAVEEEEAAAQLAVEEAQKALEDAKMRALRKRKRTPEEDEKNESTFAPVITNSNTTSNQHVGEIAAESKIKLVGAQDWYGKESKADDVQQPTKKKARSRAKKGPAVSAHFPAPSAKVMVSKSAPVLVTTEDVVMEDVPENISEISVDVKQSVLQERDSSIIGNTADDEDRPITFSGGGGNVVERVLRAEEAITPVSIQPSVLTHQIEESKILIPTEPVDERPVKIIKTEARVASGQKLKQQLAEEERLIRQMAKIARSAVIAAKHTVAETVAQNELKMPAVKKLERDAKALEFKAKSIEDKNKSRMKRPRNNNKLKVEPPKQKAKVNLQQAKKPKAVPVVDEKAKLEFLATKEQKNNDPAVIAQRLAEGLSAKGNKLRKTRRGKGNGSESVVAALKSAPIAPVLKSAVDVSPAKPTATSEKPNGAVKAPRIRRGGKNKAAPVAVEEVSKDHHS